MSWLHALRQRIRDVLESDRADRELHEEIAHHLELETRRQIAAGCDPVTAQERAIVRFGNRTLITEATRDERVARPLEGAMQDLHWAIRSLRKNAGFTALALFTLILGIGATTVAFTVLDTVLLRPLPYRDSDRLVFIRERTDKQALLPPSYPNFVSWREDARSFDGLVSAMYPFPQTVSATSAASDAVRVPAMGVSRHFFATLGVAPLIGREFTDAENTLGGPRVAMVSYEFWQSHMGARQPLGFLRLGDAAVPVIGVLPPGFRFVLPADVYFPHEQGPGTVRSAHNYLVVGRLAHGVTLAGARAAMTALSRSLLATYGSKTQAVDADVMPLRDYLVSDHRLMIAIVFGASALVLLIACTNLASAQLARGHYREHEIVVRAALGASRGRLVRQLMIESAVLVGAGAIAATILAMVATKGIRTIGANLFPRLNELTIDGRVLMFVTVVATVTGLVVGVYPARRLATRNASGVLRGTRGSMTVRASVWRALVAFEIALSVMLSIGSALLVRTLHNILTSDTGFDPHGIVTASITPGDGDVSRLDQLLADMRRLPGVAGAAYASRLPLSWGNMSAPVRRIGDPADRDWPAMAGFRLVSPEYFSVLKQPVLSGRAFASSDRAGSAGVAIVTPGIAAKLWPGQSPIGRQISTNYLFDQWLTVVGVVAEASSWRMPRGEQNEIYVPLAQHPKSTEGQLVMMIRATTDVRSVMPVVRDRLHEMLPNTPAQLGTMDERIATSAADRRFAMIALTAFGAIALLLAAVGIYGVVWYIVSTRTHEIGIRMALGATAARVRQEILGSATVMAVIGIMAGTAAGVVSTRYLTATLYGVSRFDPSAYLFAAASALVVTLIAAYVPARRSSRVDPMTAIRDSEA